MGFWITILARWSRFRDSLYPPYTMAPTALVKGPIRGFFVRVAKHARGEIITGSFPVSFIRHSVGWTWSKTPLSI